MIILTRPDGSTFEISPSAISSIRPVVKGLYPPGAQSVIRADGAEYAVKESVAQIDKLQKADR